MRGYLFILLSAVLWSTGGAGIKLLDGYAPLTISAGRAVVSAIFFAVLMRGRLVPPRGARWFTAGGALAYGTVVVTFVVSTKYTTAANAILLQYTSPLWIALLGWAFLRERPSGREIAALALGGCGIVLCMAEGLTWLGTEGEISETFLGDCIALLSGLAFGTLTVVLRFANAARQKKKGAEPYNGLWILLYGNILAFFVGAPILFSEIGHAGIVDSPVAAGWALLLWLGFAQLGLGYWFFQRGLATTRALTASLLGLIEPVLNPIWVAVLIGEIPSHGTFVGGGVVLLAVILLLRKSNDA